MATGIYESVLFELNQCRSNPSKYSSKLSNALKYYKGKIFEKPGYPPIETEEGPENVQACIKYLKSVRPAAPLEWSDVLSKAAQAHVDDIGPKGLMGHDSSDGSDASARIEKYGQWSGQLGENIDYGNCEGEDIVASLLIDDGVLARGQRLNIMKREHSYVGIGFGYHAEYEYVCVIAFAEAIFENPALPLQTPKEETVVQKKTETFKSKTTVKKYGNKESAFETFEVASYEKAGISEDDLFEVKNFFDNLDYENSGIIDTAEIRAALDSQDLDMSSQSIVNLLNEYNLETGSKVDFDEFLDMISERMSVSSTPKKPETKKTVEAKKTPEEHKKTEFKKAPEVKKTVTREPPEAKASTNSSKKRNNLTRADIEQIQEVFEAYDSERLGYIDFRDLVSSIKKGEYEHGSVWVIDTMLSIQYRGKRRVTFDELLDLLDAKAKADKEVKEKPKSTYTKTEITTTKYNYGGETYTKTTKKTVIKPAEEAFDPSEYERPGLTDEEICEIKEAFDLFDVERCGTIETRDLKNAMEAQGFQDKSPTIFKMVCELDVEGKGRVDFEEFLDMMTEHAVEDSSLEEIRKVFNLFDIDQTGYIELTNLKQIAKELGESLNEEEIIELIAKSDADGDGKVSFEEFYNIMSRTTY